MKRYELCSLHLKGDEKHFVFCCPVLQAVCMQMPKNISLPRVGPWFQNPNGTAIGHSPARLADERDRPNVWGKF